MPTDDPTPRDDASAPENDTTPRRRPKRRTPKRGTAKRRRPDADGEDAAARTEDAGGEGAVRKKRPRRRRKKRAADDGDTSTRDESPSAADAADGEGATPKKRRRRRRKRSGAASDDGDRDAAASDRDEAEGSSKGRRSKGRSRGGRGRGGKGGKSGEGRGRGEKGRREKGRAKKGRDRRDRRGRDRMGRDPRAIDIVPRPDSLGGASAEKVMLVNARDREEARIALLIDGRLEEIYVEPGKDKSAAGNIYRGRIQNVEQGIGAAFVDLGRGVTGFLHASDMPLAEGETGSTPVTERLRPGDEVLVQITRDGIGRKGPALTGRISMPGRYLVLMPFTTRSGISRRIPPGEDRTRMKRLLKQLEVPEGMGVIVRTASESTDLPALDADLQHLLSEWTRIQTRLAEQEPPGVLRGESDIAERSVRDIMPSDVARIVVDREQTAGRIHQLLRTWYPSAAAAAEAVGHHAVRQAAAAWETPMGEIEAQRAQGRDAADEDAPPTEDVEPEDGDGETDEEGVEGPVLGSDPADEIAEDDEENGFDEGLDDDADEDDADEDHHEEDDEDDDDEEQDEDVEDDDDDEDDDEDDEDEDEDDDEEDHDDDEDDELDLSELDDEAELRRQSALAQVIPDVEIHTDAIPLFHAYDVESQLENAFRRQCRLPSGGSIVIDPTEALIAIDVNSGRLTGESDPEATALRTNLEAVDEATRQLRLRDLGGLVVLDLIDMRERKSRRQVEQALATALSRDRARIRMGRMGPFGCVILSRQRIRQALTRITHIECGSCSGTGRHRHATGLGLRVLREMEARIARSRGRGGLEVRAPQPVVDWIKRHRAGVLRSLRGQASGEIRLRSDSRIAQDGWAMKGLPPGGGAAPESDEDE